MQHGVDLSESHLRRLASIRDEMKFEASILNDRTNALISAEAFLTISFTMALVNSDAPWSAKFFHVVAPMISVIGLILAVVAWPGVNSSFKIIVEWNVLLLQALDDAPEISRFMWRPSLYDGGNRHTHVEHRRSMLFARAVPVVFAVVWAILTIVVLVNAWK